VTDISQADTKRTPLEEFLAKIGQSINDAESHLKIPLGTLVPAPSVSDFEVVMKAAATVEPLLHDALEAEIKRLRKLKVEHEGAASLAKYVRKNGDFKQKAKLALEMGIIAEKRYRFICILHEIRNHYAHHIRNINLTVFDIIEKAELNVNKSFQDLGLFPFVPSDPREHNNQSLRASIHFSLAQFLADALHTINPPSPFSLLNLADEPPDGGTTEDE
jgi:hypothetical protein